MEPANKLIIINLDLNSLANLLPLLNGIETHVNRITKLKRIDLLLHHGDELLDGVEDGEVEGVVVDVHHDPEDCAD